MYPTGKDRVFWNLKAHLPDEQGGAGAESIQDTDFGENLCIPRQDAAQEEYVGFSG